MADASCESHLPAYATSTSLRIISTGATTEQMVGTELLACTVVTTKKLREAVTMPVLGATNTQIIENAAVTVSVNTSNPTGGTAVVKV